MLGERELLHQEILPKVNEFARKNGEYVECVDLRWGLDTDHLAKTLEVCLSQIKDPCKYNMIIFIGYSYGSIPKPEVLKEQWEKVAGTSSELADYSISFTQFELEYGVFRECAEKGNPIQICLFRKFTNKAEEYEPKQEELVDRLKLLEICKKDYEARWDGYKAVDLEEMKKILIQELQNHIKDRIKEKEGMNWIEKTLLEAEAFRSQLTQHFFGREQLVEAVKEAMSDQAVQSVLVYGESAIGKSSLLSKVYEEIPYQDKYFIACGHTERSRTYEDVLLQMIYFVEKNLPRNIDKKATAQDPDSKAEVKPKVVYTEEKAELLLSGMLEEYNAKGEKVLYIFVDAIDKLKASHDIKLYRLFGDKGKVKLVCSLMSDKEPDEIKKGTRTIKMPQLSGQDIKEIVEGNMFVAESYTDKMADAFQKDRQSANPLYITSAINYLQMNLENVIGEERDDIYKYFLGIIRGMPEKLTDLCWNVLEKAGDYLQFPAWRLTCGMIAASQNGLRSFDLEQLFCRYGDKEEQKKGWRFDLFKAYLNKNLYFRIQENGCWTFGHDMIKEGVISKLGDNISEYKDNLFEYLQTLPAHDEVKIEEGLILSSEKDEISFAGKILNEALGTSDTKEIALIVQTLYEIVANRGGVKWYLNLMDTYNKAIFDILKEGLRYNGGPEYDRRYPAKELMDMYWTIFNIRKLCDTLNSIPENEKLAFCSACAQYVGIYEDISEHEKAFIYEYPVYLYIKECKFDELCDEDKGELFICANLIFYSNNKIINNIKNKKTKAYQLCLDAYEISQGLLEWYKDTIETEEAAFYKREVTEGKFVSNIGQYYEAIGRYKTAYGYRAKALRIKSGVFFSRLDVSDNKWRNNFEMLIEQEHFSLPTHRDYWEEMWQEIDEETLNKAEGGWKLIATSYRTIATDCFYLADNNDLEDSEKEARIQEAIGFHDLCIFMQSRDFVKNAEKETAVTYIRKLGSYKKLYSMLPSGKYEPDVINACARKAAELTERHAFQDKQEQQKLRKTLNEFKDLFEKEGLDTAGLEEAIQILPKEAVK